MSIICTLGPSSNDLETIRGLRDAGVSIFRINLSHAPLADIKKFFAIGEKLNIRIAIDTEGAQIRTDLLSQANLSLDKGDTVYIFRDSASSFSSSFQSSTKNLSFSPSNVLPRLCIGDKLRLDFNGAVIEVVASEEDYLTSTCISSGVVGQNKGVDLLNRAVPLDDFTAKDLEALQIANGFGIKDVFISFCKSVDSITTVRSQVRNATVFSKIESRASIHELSLLCQHSDAILIDRGDLSREVSILDMPFAQRGIISMAKRYSTPCYVATNVLESLITLELPTRAELNDIVSTLEMGAAGIVLAAETAIGNKPILCAEIVKELMHKLSLYNSSLLFADLDRNEITDPAMKVWLNRDYS